MLRTEEEILVPFSSPARRRWDRGGGPLLSRHSSESDGGCGGGVGPVLEHDSKTL